MFERFFANLDANFLESSLQCKDDSGANHDTAASTHATTAVQCVELSAFEAAVVVKVVPHLEHLTWRKNPTNLQIVVL